MKIYSGHILGSHLRFTFEPSDENVELTTGDLLNIKRLEIAVKNTANGNATSLSDVVHILSMVSQYGRIKISIEHDGHECREEKKSCDVTGIDVSSIKPMGTLEESILAKLSKYGINNLNDVDCYFIDYAYKGKLPPIDFEAFALYSGNNRIDDLRVNQEFIDRLNSIRQRYSLPPLLFRSHSY